MLLVDLDPQACLTFSLGVDPDAVESSVHDVLVGGTDLADVVVTCEEGIDLVPSTIDLAGAEAVLLSRPAREYVLQGALDDVRRDYDVILLDCSPSLGRPHPQRPHGRPRRWSSRCRARCSATGASASCSTPCATSSGSSTRSCASSASCRRSTTVAARTRARSSPTSASGTTCRCSCPPIPKTVRFAEAPAVGRSILSTARSSKGAAAYREVAASLLTQL